MDGGVGRDHFLHEVVKAGFVDHKSSQRSASLATSTDSREDGSLQGHILISIVHDYGSVVSSKLEDLLAKAGGKSLTYVSSDLG